MNKLTFNASKSICHKIVTDSNGKKYLMDTSTLRPNVYGFGFLPKRVRVEMVEIDKKVAFLIRKQKLMERQWLSEVRWQVHLSYQSR